MSEPMETGGVGKNPAIDKINDLNAAESHANAVIELERRVFRTEQPRAKEALQRRRQLIEDFQISFKRKEKKEDGDILHGGEQRLYTRERSVYGAGDGYNRDTNRIPGRILSDGRREAVQDLSRERKTGYYSGE